MIQFTHLLRYSLVVLLLFLTIQNSTVSAQKQNQTVQFTRLGVPISVVPGITGNVLTVVSFLVGTSSFLVGLRIQNATGTAIIVIISTSG